MKPLAHPDDFHCDSHDCGGPLSCSCKCIGCHLPELLERMARWSVQAASAQLELDLHGADREKVAQIAGRLLDLSEAIGRTVIAARGGRFAT